MEVTNRKTEKRMWETYWHFKNKNKRPEDKLTLSLYLECDRKMRYDKFKNYRLEINEENNKTE